MSLSQNDRPDINMLLIDGADIVNMLRTHADKTFHECAQQVFRPFLKSQLDIVRRVDCVGCSYSRQLEIHCT